MNPVAAVGESCHRAIRAAAATLTLSAQDVPDRYGRAHRSRHHLPGAHAIGFELDPAVFDPSKRNLEKLLWLMGRR